MAWSKKNGIESGDEKKENAQQSLQFCEFVGRYFLWQPTKLRFVYFVGLRFWGAYQQKMKFVYYVGWYFLVSTNKF